MSNTESRTNTITTIATQGSNMRTRFITAFCATVTVLVSMLGLTTVPANALTAVSTYGVPGTMRYGQIGVTVVDSSVPVEVQQIRLASPTVRVFESPKATVVNKAQQVCARTVFWSVDTGYFPRTWVSEGVGTHCGWISASGSAVDLKGFHFDQQWSYNAFFRSVRQVTTKVSWYNTSNQLIGRKMYYYDVRADYNCSNLASRFSCQWYSDASFDPVAGLTVQQHF